MSCGGGSFNDDCSSVSTWSSSYGGYRSPENPEERNKRKLKNIKNSYEHKLKKARENQNYERRVKLYAESLEQAEKYFEESERMGITVEEMPDRDHVLPQEDVDWISQKHYDNFFWHRNFGTGQTENLEKLLKESGNDHRIKSNGSCPNPENSSLWNLVIQ